MAFNRSNNMDGKYRDGSIYWYFNNPSYLQAYIPAGATNPNASSVHDYGMANEMDFSGYEVDNWKVDLADLNKRLRIIALMPFNYVASTTPMKWSYVGAVNFTNTVDNTKTLTVSFDLEKTLVNSTDKRIYDQADPKNRNIHWSNFYAGPVASTGTLLPPAAATIAAQCAYTGTMAGVTSTGKNFKFVIDKDNPLMRDFGCYADKILGTAVVNGSFVPRFSEYHPFTKGVASMTVGSTEPASIGAESKSKIYPRKISYGNEDDLSLPFNCDNQGIVNIKGIGYKVDWKKK
jgi:hypothetical protein